MGVRGQPTKWDKWYSTARWGRIRKYQLLEYPLCKYCLERAIVTPATICDHVEPHRGNINRFWLALSSRSESHVTIARSGWSRRYGFRPDVGLMGGLWTRAIRSIEGSEASTDPAGAGPAAGAVSSVSSLAADAVEPA
jgi:hypothetical protein